MTLLLAGDTVVKYGTGSVALEAAKLRAYSGASTSGVYVVPAVLYSDAGRDLMVLERLHGYIPLQEVFLRSGADCKLALSVFERAGTALADIHRSSSPQSEWVRANVQVRQTGADSVLLHEDFGFSNVLYKPGQDALAIIDPSPPLPTHRQSAIGARVFDVGTMMSCLLGRVSPSHLLGALALPRRQLMERFFYSYEAVEPCGYSFEAALGVSIDQLRVYLARRRGVPSRSISPLIAWLIRGL